MSSSRAILNLGKSKHYKWTSATVRNAFYQFFANSNHDFVMSSPVIPWNDRSISFVNAGMNQFKPIFLGNKKSQHAKVYNSQKCIRAGGKHNDLQDVGRDTYHHTFFEMLGSWSFEDYFKEEACQLAWDLIMKVFHINPSCVFVTYFGGDVNASLLPDLETKNIWLKIGVPESRIIPFGMNENFWEMGNVGPCGPSTEIHILRKDVPDPYSLVNAGAEELIELWNLVFIQYERKLDGSLKPLKTHYVDTGMGLERLLATLNHKISNYDTDLFQPIFDKLQKISGAVPYKGTFDQSDNNLDMAYRIVADHSRMMTHALSDGLLPQDEYTLRSVIRRSLLLGWKNFSLQKHTNFLAQISECICEVNGEVYPELERNLSRVKILLEYEEELLRQNMLQSTEPWKELLSSYPQLKNVNCVSLEHIRGLKEVLPQVVANKSFPLEAVQVLHCNYTLPLELISEVADAFSFDFDESQVKRYTSEETAGRKIETLYSNLTNVFENYGIQPTDDSFKYAIDPKKPISHKSEVVAVIKNSELVTSIGISNNDTLSNINKYGVVLDSTIFYAAAGGQAADTGSLKIAYGSTVNVLSVQNISGRIIHWVDVKEGKLCIGDKVDCKINTASRRTCMQLHTAHHLFMAALKSVTGTAHQRGSTITKDNFNLDIFVHPTLTLEQIQEAETIVRAWISQKQPVHHKTLPLPEALRLSDVSLVSGELYPNDVQVVTTSYSVPSAAVAVARVSDNDGDCGVNMKSCELCCGTHVDNTGLIQDFSVTNVIFKEYGMSSIEAVVGPKATALNVNRSAIVEETENWRKKVHLALYNNERVRQLEKDLKHWKNSISRKKYPFLVYNKAMNTTEDLMQKLWKELRPESNWKELQTELETAVSTSLVDSVVHLMSVDYRGSQTHLVTIISDFNTRPVMFVCKGWGKLRACAVLPKKYGEANDWLQPLKDIIESGDIVNHVNNENFSIASFFANGIKRDVFQKVLPQIIQVCEEISTKYR